MNSNTKFLISIHDGWVEYSMPLEVPADSSIYTVACKIREAFNQPPPGKSVHEIDPLHMRTSFSFINEVTSIRNK